MMSASSSKAITNVLTSGQTLGWKDKLGYPNSNVSLILWPNCELVLYDDEHHIQWQSNSSGSLFSWFCTLSLTDKGRLVLTDNFGEQVWLSDNDNSTAGKYVAAVRPDATLTIYRPAIWTVGLLTEKESNIGINSNSDVNNNEVVSSMTNLKNTPANNALFSSDILYNGRNISENGYSFILDDCELIFKDSYGSDLWRTFTHGYGKNCYARLDFFGVLAIFDEPGNAVWTNKKQLAHPTPYGQYALVIQSDGTASIYGSDVWSMPERLLSTIVIPRDDHIKMPTDVKM